MTSKTQAAFDEIDRLKAEADRLGLEPPGGRRAGWTLEELRHAVARVHETLTVRPGDKLLVRVAPSTGMKQAEDLRDALSRRLPEVEVTVVAAEQLAVVRD